MIDPPNPGHQHQQQWGPQPPMAPGGVIGQPGMQQGVPNQVHWGAAPPGPTPVNPVMMSTGAKLGLFIGLGSAVLGVIVTIVVVSVNVMGVGLGGADDTSTACGRTVACCKKIAAGAGTADNCNNFKKLGVTDQMCSSALEGFETAAKAQGLSCE